MAKTQNILFKSWKPLFWKLSEPWRLQQWINDVLNHDLTSLMKSLCTYALEMNLAYYTVQQQLKHTQMQKHGHGQDLSHSSYSPFLRQIRPVILVYTYLSLHNLQSTDMELFAWGLQVRALYRANLVSSTLRLKKHIYFWIANDHEIIFLINYIENTFFFNFKKILRALFFL